MFSLPKKTPAELEAEILVHIQSMEASDKQFRFFNSTDTQNAMRLIRELVSIDGYKPQSDFLRTVGTSALVRWAMWEQGDTTLELLQDKGLVATEWSDAANIFIALQRNLPGLFNYLIDKFAQKSSREDILFILQMLKGAVSRVHLVNMGHTAFNSLSGSMPHAKSHYILEAIERVVLFARIRARKTPNEIADLKDSAGAAVVRPYFELTAEAFFTEEDCLAIDAVAKSARAEMTQSCIEVYTSDKNDFIDALLNAGVDLSAPVLPSGDSLLEMAAKRPHDGFTFLKKRLYEIMGPVNAAEVLWKTAHELLIKEKTKPAMRVIDVLPKGGDWARKSYNGGNAQLSLIQRCLQLGLAGEDESLECYQLIATLLNQGASFQDFSSESCRKFLLLVLKFGMDDVAKWFARMNNEAEDLFGIIQGQDPLTGKTILHEAVCLDTTTRQDFVRRLLENIAPENVVAFVNLKNTEKSTALHFAAGAGNVNAVRKLIVAGASVSEVNVQGFQPIHMAAASKNPGCAEIIKVLLEPREGQNPVDVNVPTTPPAGQGDCIVVAGSTIAHLAVLPTADDHGVLKAVMEAGADFTQMNADRLLPLHYLLLEYGGKYFSFSEMPARLAKSEHIFEKIKIVLEHCPSAANTTISLQSALVSCMQYLPLDYLFVVDVRRPRQKPSYEADLNKQIGAYSVRTNELILLFLKHTSPEVLANSPNLKTVNLLLRTVEANNPALLTNLLAKGFFVDCSDTAVDANWKKLLFAAVRKTNNYPMMLSSLLGARRTAEADSEYCKRRKAMLRACDPETGECLLHTAIICSSPHIASALLNHHIQDTDDLVFILELRSAHGSTPLELVNNRHRPAHESEDNPLEWRELRDRLERLENALRSKRAPLARLRAVVAGLFIGAAWVLCSIAGIFYNNAKHVSILTQGWEQYVTRMLKPPLSAARPLPDEEVRRTQQRSTAVSRPQGDSDAALDLHTGYTPQQAAASAAATSTATTSDGGAAPVLGRTSSSRSSTSISL